jgi:phage protein D
MSNTDKPRVRESIQFIQHDEVNAELHVVFEDDAAALLWAAQWLDEHREYTMTAIRLDHTADPDDEHDVTATLVVSLHQFGGHGPGRLGPWPHGVPPTRL